MYIFIENIPSGNKKKRSAVFHIAECINICFTQLSFTFPLTPTFNMLFSQKTWSDIILILNLASSSKKNHENRLKFNKKKLQKISLPIILRASRKTFAHSEGHNNRSTEPIFIIGFLWKVWLWPFIFCSIHSIPLNTFVDICVKS